MCESLLLWLTKMPNNKSVATTKFIFGRNLRKIVTSFSACLALSHRWGIISLQNSRSFLNRKFNKTPVDFDMSTSVQMCYPIRFFCSSELSKSDVFHSSSSLQWENFHQQFFQLQKWNYANAHDCFHSYFVSFPLTWGCLSLAWFCFFWPSA